VGDSGTHEAVVVDPAGDGERIAAEAKQRRWQINQIWLTHAHFDHIVGIEGIVKGTNPPPAIALHPADLPLYSAQGGAALFGMYIGATHDPTVELNTTNIVGESIALVRHCPGILLGMSYFLL
jgi:glyoxylase-like metal-dependent hydrolase (beta-lactamase superfamily II)